MPKRIAVCPGSFDPITMGHIDIIRRASAVFDRVIVTVMTNTAKEPTFSAEERLDMINRSIANLPGNIEAEIFGGLLADYVKQKNACAIVKGLRAVSDFEYEFQMALINKKINPGTETLFFTTSAENMYLSSSVVRSVASVGGDISPFVPECIIEDIERKFSAKC
ncbi:MAG: pantetheine-phosphate adenylyltransferase [Acutalibacteraceae bacterium]